MIMRPPELEWSSQKRSGLGWALAALALLAALGCGPDPEEEARRRAEEARLIEAQARAEETSRKAALAVEMAEDARRIVDEAYEKAEAAQREARLRQREASVQSAVQQTALAQAVHYVETGRFAADYEELSQYGWRRDPGLIYEDIRLGLALSGEPNFRVTVRHPDPEVRAFRYDHAAGRGVEAVDPQRADEVFARPPATGGSAKAAPAESSGEVAAPKPAELPPLRPGGARTTRSRERAVQTALMQTALALVYHKEATGAYADRYEKLEAYGWRRDPDVIYSEIQLGVSIEGKPNFKLTFRHRDPSIQAFKYDTQAGGGVTPAGQ